MGMYKKNSILDRPIRPPSARNVESGPVEHARAIEAQKRLAERFRRYDPMEGYSSRHQWADPGHLYTTSYDTRHRLQTVVTDGGLKTIPRSDVDVPSGVMRVPAPGNARRTSPRIPPRSARGRPPRSGRLTLGRVPTAIPGHAFAAASQRPQVRGSRGRSH